KVEVAAMGDVDRAKLYYRRGRVGKRARVRERGYGAGSELPAAVEGALAETDEAPEPEDAEGPQSEAEPVEAEAEQVDEEPAEAEEPTTEEAPADEGVEDAPADEDSEPEPEEEAAGEPETATAEEQLPGISGAASLAPRR